MRLSYEIKVYETSDPKIVEYESPGAPRLRVEVSNLDTALRLRRSEILSRLAIDLYQHGVDNPVDISFSVVSISKRE